MTRTITVELDDDDAASLSYCALERAGGDEQLAIRQAIDEYRGSIFIEHFRAKEARIAAQPEIVSDPNRPESPAAAEYLDKIFGTTSEKHSAA